MVRDVLQALGPVEPQDAAHRAGVVRVDPVREAVGLGREEVRVRFRRDARDLREVLLEKRLVDRDRRVVDEAVRDDLLEEAPEEPVRKLAGGRDVRLRPSRSGAPSRRKRPDGESQTRAQAAAGGRRVARHGGSADDVFRAVHAEHVAAEPDGVGPRQGDEDPRDVVRASSAGPRGGSRDSARSSAALSGILRSAGVSVTPARIAFTAIFRGASSTASCRQWLSSAALAAETAP